MKREEEVHNQMRVKIISQGETDAKFEENEC